MKTTIRNFPSRIEDPFWITNALGIGAWEAVALLTKKVPTVSGFCRLAKQRHEKSTEATIIIWLMGLGLHLLRPKNK